MGVVTFDRWFLTWRMVWLAVFKGTAHVCMCAGAHVKLRSPLLSDMYCCSPFTYRLTYSFIIFKLLGVVWNLGQSYKENKAQKQNIMPNQIGSLLKAVLILILSFHLNYSLLSGSNIINWLTTVVFFVVFLKVNYSRKRYKSFLHYLCMSILF